MSAMEFLCCSIGINPANFLKKENIILEIEFFHHLCNKFEKMMKLRCKEYFKIIKANGEMEEAMIKANFIRYIINDILSTKLYTLDGIAIYTNTPLEVIHEIAMGINTNPTLLLSRKIIELHRTVREKLYCEILRKALQEAEHKNSDV